MFSVTRRRFLHSSAGLLACGLGTPAAGSSEPLTFRPGNQPDAPVQQPAGQPLALGEIPANFWSLPREIWLHRPRTNESLRLVYFKDGRLDTRAYWQVCALLRDVRANRMAPMDPLILDVLRGIFGFYQAWGYNVPILVTSGFRTKQTNNALEGAAQASQHLFARAVDIRMPGIRANDLGRIAQHLKAGGVGFYPHRDFVHVDTGHRRAWVGR